MFEPTRPVEPMMAAEEDIVYVGPDNSKVVSSSEEFGQVSERKKRLRR